jgi:hypothetical protein
MSMKTISCMATTILIMCCAICNGAEYCIATNGSNSANGDRLHPWQTLMHAISFGKLVAGDCIIMADGVYETGNINISCSGNDKQYIKIMSASAGKATIRGSLWISGKYIWIQGLKFEAATNSDPQGSAGVTMFSADNHIINCGFRGYKGAAINVMNKSEVYGCLIADIGYDAADRAHGHGIYVAGGDGNVIEDNVICNCKSCGIHAYAKNSPHLMLRGNVCYGDGQGACILAWEHQPCCDIINNVLYGREGISVRGDDNGGIRIVDNTIISPGRNVDGLISDDGFGIRIGDGPPFGPRITNNSLYGFRMMISLDKSLRLSTVFIENNQYGARNEYLFAYGGNSFTLEQWQAQGFEESCRSQWDPKRSIMFVRKNKYDPTRIYLARYGTVADSVSGMRIDCLRDGAKFKVYEVADQAKPIADGTYDSKVGLILKLKGRSDQCEFHAYVILEESRR